MNSKRYALNPKKEEVNVPPILYKYRIWSNLFHRRVLSKNEFYLAPFSSFNSRHEHNLPTDYESVTDEDLLSFFYLSAERDYKITAHEAKLKFAKNQIQITPGRNKKHQEWVEKKYREIYDRKRGVLSLSLDRDNLYLWNTFSLQCSGFVVGLDSDFLFKNGEPIGMFSPVDYYSLDKVPKIKALRSMSEDDPIEDSFRFVNSLPDTYENEKEYRLSKVLKGKSRKLHIHKKYFKELILGHRMSEIHKQEVLAITRRRFPECKLYQQFLQDDFMVINPIN